jgi:hypothetical protein
MLSNRPLFPTRADAPYFVWTGAAAQLRDALRLGRNSLLLGERGSGKTSTLHMVEQELRSGGERPVAFAALAGAEDVAAALLAIDHAAVEEGWLPPAESTLLDAVAGRADPFAPTRLLRRLHGAPAGAVLLLDDVGSGAGSGLFGRLRDELWQLGLMWAVAARPDDGGALLRPPADAFFERTIVLSELDGAERAELLCRRAADSRNGFDGDRARALAEAGPGNPRELIAFARDSSETGLSPAALSAAADRRRAAADEAAGPSGARLVAELEGLGAVSAGDARLLDRLGWDRPRAARTLSQLEKAGIVRSHLEPREGRSGRPRKLYALPPASEFARS